MCEMKLRVLGCSRMFLRLFSIMQVLQGTSDILANMSIILSTPICKHVDHLVYSYSFDRRHSFLNTTVFLIVIRT
jgi:hypothetical protein